MYLDESFVKLFILYDNVKVSMYLILCLSREECLRNKENNSAVIVFIGLFNHETPVLSLRKSVQNVKSA